MANEGNRRLVLAPLLLLAGWVIAEMAATKVGVRGNETQQRFEQLSRSGWENGYRFAVFHDKASGVEFICVENDVHFNPSCFPSGRSWK